MGSFRAQRPIMNLKTKEQTERMSQKDARNMMSMAIFPVIGARSMLRREFLRSEGAAAAVMS